MTFVVAYPREVDAVHTSKILIECPMFRQNKDWKTPRRRDPSGERLMATTLGSLRSYLSASNQSIDYSPHNKVCVIYSSFDFGDLVLAPYQTQELKDLL